MLSCFSFFPFRKYSLVAAVSNLHIFDAECNQLRHERDNAVRQIDALLNQNTVGRIQIEEAKMGILTVKTSRLSFILQLL